MSTPGPFAFGQSAFGIGSFGFPIPPIPTVTPNTVTLQKTIPSYLYEQYQGDDSCQAFVDSYNLATQTQLDWLNSVNLPYYPGLSGALLDWVAVGLYGIARTSLTAPGTSALGMFNTVPFNTMPLNTYVPPTTIYYTLSDDAYKRVITWDYYKGDGRQFGISWLKRRIMRFLVGVNGIDPQPSQPGFTVGAETTSALNVQIDTATNVVTVWIDQTRLGNQAFITPGILQVFQIAFETQYLELPIQYTYVVNIVSAVVAFVSPASISSVGPNASQTTQPVTVSAYAGSEDYAYAWTWESGGTGIAINEPTAPVTTFSASGLTFGQNVSGVAQCIVTDLITLEVATIFVPVSITFASVDLLQLNGGQILLLNGNPLLLG